MLASALVTIALAAAPAPQGKTWTIPLPGEPLGERPGVTGMVRVHRAMKPAVANGLLPRDVFVWLPRGYDNAMKADQRYPVLYMQDGQNAFDPSTRS